MTPRIRQLKRLQKRAEETGQVGAARLFASMAKKLEPKRCPTCEMWAEKFNCDPPKHDCRRG